MAIKIFFFDCDGTLTKTKSSWEYLHRRLNLWKGKADLYEKLFKEGKIDYYEFCKKDALLWKGLSVHGVVKVIEEIPLFDGAKELVAYLKGKGIYTAIISTGLSFVVERVRNELQIDFAVGNELISERGVLTGEIKINVQYGGKGLWVKRILNELSIGKEEAAAIGDGRGDEGMFEEVLWSIGFNVEGGSKNPLRFRIESHSLLPIIDLIGKHI